MDLKRNVPFAMPPPLGFTSRVVTRRLRMRPGPESPADRDGHFRVVRRSRGSDAVLRVATPESRRVESTVMPTAWDTYRNALPSIAHAVGRTPLVRLNRVTADVRPAIYLKIEWFGPSGSLKDRIYLHMF